MILGPARLPEDSQDVEGGLAETNLVAFFHPVPTFLARNDQAERFPIAFLLQVVDEEVPFIIVDA
jgi:hypothetical protein